MATPYGSERARRRTNSTGPADGGVRSGSVKKTPLNSRLRKTTTTTAATPSGGRSRSVPTSGGVVASPRTGRAPAKRVGASPRGSTPRKGATPTQQHQQQQQQQPRNPDEAWKIHRNSSGRVYYWNTISRESRWTLPPTLRVNQKSEAERAEIQRRISEATSEMHHAASKIQGLALVRAAKLEVLRRKKNAKYNKSLGPRSSTPSKPTPPGKATSTPQSFGRSSSKHRTHSTDTPRKPGRAASTPKRNHSVGQPVARQSSYVRRFSGQSLPRGTSPVSEKFRRSSTHSHTPPSKMASPKGTQGNTIFKDVFGVKRSTSRGRTSSAKGSTSRTPSAPTSSTRSGSRVKSPRRSRPETPTTLDDPRYQEGGYLSVASGHKLDNYELLMQLGTGQSATVWLAADTTHTTTRNSERRHPQHKFVAIKITQCSESVRCSSLHEVALLYYVANKSTVRQKGFETGSALLLNHFEHKGRHGSHVCMVFEVLGPTLDVLMSRTNFRGLGDLDLIADITISILFGLDELASMNVVHTDLKPENIMFSRPSVSVRKAIAKYESQDGAKITESVDDERQVKISDFGLSYLLRPDDDTHLNGEKLSASDLQLIFASNYTKGAVIQTREYRAPEIILGMDFSTRTDIWSLACIVYELLTGQFLFDPKTVSHVVDEQTMDVEHITEMMSIMGQPDQDVRKGDGVYLHKFFNESGTFIGERVSEVDVKSVVERSIPASCPDPEVASLISDFITSALTWVPGERLSSSDCLNHPWLRDRVEKTYPGRKPLIPPTKTWPTKPSNAFHRSPLTNTYARTNGLV
eukprot:TRINITY_DN13636_c4_g1_i2.p1 TRINITY_DN13636_c4_g1~~TRINITY_DN13636_c4_g1_i2.p1  ORF type:complete len:805 (+),score=125.39 TRINITY_DN13636_c4_g1_i2:56-2470(+)